MTSLTSQRPKVVFLDRIAIRAPLRKLKFDHNWFEHLTTAPEDLLHRLDGPSIAITNRAQFGDEQSRITVKATIRIQCRMEAMCLV